MPRISTKTILQAYQQNAFLPLLLRECRSLNTAQNELRWLRERAFRVILHRSRKLNGRTKYPYFGWRTLLKTMCQSRSRGKPLQYILGDQPFGSLDIKCRKGVLIPRYPSSENFNHNVSGGALITHIVHNYRPETETFTFHTAKLIQDNIKSCGYIEDKPLRILDLCTGTGCISLLLHSLLSHHFPQISILGVDICDVAIQLARENTKRNVSRGLLSRRALSEVCFRRGSVLGRHSDIPGIEDILEERVCHISSSSPLCDVLISNPPYISLKEFQDGTTARGVRVFEPKLALVPPEDIGPPYSSVRHEDLFYHRIISLLYKLQARLIVLECGSRHQAGRVASLFRNSLDACSGSNNYLVDIWPHAGFVTDAYAVVAWNRGIVGRA